jgi:hypothetical protein
MMRPKSPGLRTRRVTEVLLPPVASEHIADEQAGNSRVTAKLPAGPTLEAVTASGIPLLRPEREVSGHSFIVV